MFANTEVFNFVDCPTGFIGTVRYNDAQRYPTQSNPSTFSTTLLHLSKMAFLHPAEYCILRTHTACNHATMRLYKNMYKNNARCLNAIVFDFVVVVFVNVFAYWVNGKPCTMGVDNKQADHAHDTQKREHLVTT